MRQPVSANKQKPRRPFWVWLISAFFLFCGTMNLCLLWVIANGSLQLPPAELAAIRKAALAWTLFGLLPAANLAGAIFLFLLRKAAFYIFSAMFIAGLANAGIQLLLLDTAPSQFTGQGLWQALTGYAITLAVCIYTFRLKQRHILS